MALALFDSHCHLDFARFSTNLRGHLEDAERVGGCRWFVPGCRVEASDELRQLVDRLAPRFSLGMGAGQHPYFAGEVTDLDELGASLSSLLSEGTACAIGECGLDRKRGGDPKWQSQVLETHLRVALEHQAPIVVHQVGLREELLRALERVGLPPGRGVVHGFGGDIAWATALLRRGFFLGLGPALTRVERHRLREAAARVPLESIFLETDAPDQRVSSASPGQGGADFGVPADISVVCAELARVRGCDLGLVARTTFENAEKFFGAARAAATTTSPRPGLDPV